MMVWISDRCFIICELPPLGMAAALARSIPTRTVCVGDSGPAASRSRIWRHIRSITRSGEVFDVSMLISDGFAVRPYGGGFGAIHGTCVAVW
jgi:hypothetical protein